MLLVCMLIPLAASHGIVSLHTLVLGLAGVLYSTGDLWMGCLVLPEALVVRGAEKEEEDWCQTRALWNFSFHPGTAPLS